MPFSAPIGSGDTWGGTLANTLDYTGPASYPSGGDPISPAAFGFEGIENLFPAISEDATYAIWPQPQASGNITPTWKARWITLSTGAEVSPGTNLSASKCKLGGIGR